MQLEVLVADPGSRQGIRSLAGMLQETEYVIRAYAGDLNEAMQLLLHRHFDILICINRSPSFFAAKMLRLIGQSAVQIPTVVISLSEDPQRMRECFLLGAIDFLSEPLEPDELMHALGRAAELIHARLIDTEYNTAMEQALAALPRTEQNAPIIEKLRAFLETVRGQTATVELAADYFGFNRDYFGRYFKSRFGMTFGEFYKGFQIGYAKLLLETGQFKVLEVSRQLGFSSQDYFTRVFKRRTGVIPSLYKKKADRSA